MQNEGIFSHLVYERLVLHIKEDILQRTSTMKYISCKIFQAFDPGTEIFVPNMTYEADYLTWFVGAGGGGGGINHYWNKKKKQKKKNNCQLSDYKTWLSLMGTLAIVRMTRI